MTKQTPNWAIWRHMPELKAQEAVALSLNLDPSSVHRESGDSWAYSSGKNSAFSVADFAGRLLLYRRVHRAPLSAVELSAWAQSVGWNIPLELAALSPVQESAELPKVDESAVHAALTDAILEGGTTAELRQELERLGCQFVVLNGEPMLNIPDGTIKGRYEPLAHCYRALCNLYDSNPKAVQLGRLIRSSGASGGGARGGGELNRFSTSIGMPPKKDTPADEVVHVVNVVPEDAKEKKLPDVKSSMSPKSCPADWQIIEPAKLDPLATMIYNALHSIRREGRPTPKAAAVVEHLIASKPAEFIGSINGGIEWYNALGDIEHTSNAEIQRRIGRMTGKKAKR